LNRPPGSEVAIPDTCLQVAFRLDVAAAARLVDLQNPMLGMLRAEEMARAAAAGMARKMGFPMIGVGVQYMVLGRLPGDAMGMGKMGGMDMVMPMVSVSIPLFRGKYRAARVENELAARESAARRDDALRELEAGLHDSRHALDEAARKIALARRQAALAGVTVELLTREFASGRGGIEEVLQARRQLVKFRLVGVEAVVEYNTRAAAVQRAISRPE
jgi:outer membrane protein TolC